MKQIILRDTRRTEDGDIVTTDKVLHTFEEAVKVTDESISMPNSVTLPFIPAGLIHRSINTPPLKEYETKLSVPEETKIKEKPAISNKEFLRNLGLKSGTPDHIKLDPEKVKAMRQMARDGMDMDDIAREFGISKSGAYQAVNKMTWKHVE